MLERRRFLAKASGAAAVAATLIADVVEEMSGGRFRIEVFPGGQIMQPFECFDATSKGTIEAEGARVRVVHLGPLRHGSPGKETYAPFNLVPRLGPGFAPQMGGWFRKKINTIGDYKGLKMRIAGLGGKVIARAGATPVLAPAAETECHRHHPAPDAGAGESQGHRDRTAHRRAPGRRPRRRAQGEASAPEPLSNALKFTPAAGRVDVRAGARDGVAEISVTDTGVGIAAEDQEAVFEEFRQVGASAKRVEGTGLGLALSREFVELHGGRIWVTSQVGVGSTFTFTLPIGADE